MERDYEIFFYLQIENDQNFDLSLLPKSNFFTFKYMPIGTISKYSNKPSKISSLEVSTKTQGKETLASLFEFINNLIILNKFFIKYYNNDKVLYISQNYWYQCNFEIDVDLLAMLVKYNISLAISSIYCGNED